MLSPTWQAILEDGGIIEQGDIPYTDLFTKRFRLKAFRLIDKQENRVLIVVHLDRNKRLIFRARHETKVNVGDTGRTIWVVGWQQTLPNFRDERGNPCNVQHVSLLYWNGVIVTRDGFGGDAGYPIEPLQAELDAGMIDPRTIKSSTEPNDEDSGSVDKSKRG